MKELLWAIFMYPFVLVDDIWSFFYRLKENVKYSLNRPQFSYDDVTEVEFFYDYIMDLGSTIFYEEGNNKPVDEYAEIIALGKEQFSELINVLKENRIFDYKKNIFRFSITPFMDLLATDTGEGEERLTIKFRNGQVFKTSSYCTSKRFDTVVKYLVSIEDRMKNKEKVKKVVIEKTKKDGFDWVCLINEMKGKMDKIIINKEYHFDEYTPFNSYLEMLMNEIRDKRIKCVFTTSSLSLSKDYKFSEKLYSTASNLFIILDNDMVINIEYYFYSIIYIKYMHIDDLSEEEKEFSESCRYELKIEDAKIVDYELESFHDEYETNPSTGETRPEGGDYFKQISFVLDNDNKLCICAEDSEVDGYCDVWVEHI